MNEWRVWWIIAFVGITVLVICEIMGVPID